MRDDQGRLCAGFEKRPGSDDPAPDGGSPGCDPVCHGKRSGAWRDDAASFLGSYTQKGILAADPFVTIGQEGVGELIRLAAERGRQTRNGIKLGICGEHGGDPASIHFCQDVGLDYVSCSPYRVPIARLAAAQAALGGKAEDPM